MYLYINLKTAKPNNFALFGDFVSKKNVEIFFRLEKLQNAEMSPSLLRQDFVDQIERPHNELSRLGHTI